jgi:hypothetical protein
MIPRPQYVLPAQRVIYEKGGAAGLPGISEAFTSQWFDVLQVHKGGIQVPQTGAIVDGGSEIRRGVGTTLRVGLYYLDVWTEHSNALFVPYQLIIRASNADALESALFQHDHYSGWWVPSDGSAFFGDVIRNGNFRRFPIYSRFVRLAYTYADQAATRFSLTATLRAF